jgi:outer membrane protein assembly factor BamE
MRRCFRFLAAPLAALCGACGVYRMDIQQGNFLAPAAMSQLKLGMTKDQVRFVLGTPLLADIFHEERWDYVYWRKPSNSNEIEERKVSVFFRDGRLVRLEGDVVPAGARAASAPESTK